MGLELGCSFWYRDLCSCAEANPTTCMGMGEERPLPLDKTERLTPEATVDFTIMLTDEVAIGCYTRIEFKRITDELFGLACKGQTQWFMERDEMSLQTVYRGTATPEVVNLWIALARGEAIRYLDMMESRCQ